MQPETAVAVREDQHPIIAKIDAKMPEIAQMLPEGMSADRFRRVVVQALVRNPDLWQCTPVSVVSAIVEAAQLGLEPTGVLGRAWMLPYNKRLDDGTWIKEAKLIPGYRGYAELAWRADKILVTTGAVRQGDEFSYRRGTGKYLHHIPASDDPEREADDTNITDFWAMYTLPDGREDFDVMSRRAVERIRDKARKKNPVWESDFGEMGRKTVLRRLLKVAPLSPEVQRLIARDEEVDFDTPVERVNPKHQAMRERIAERTAALRGESTGESEGSQMEGAGVSADQPEEEARSAERASAVNSSSGGSPAPRDRWMARLHAVGSERGYDHDALSDWAQRTFRVQSLKDLTTSQRADFMEMVERLPIVQAPIEPPVARDGGPEVPSPAESGPEAVPPAVSGPPPKPGTPEYGALTPAEKAKARAYWADRRQEEHQETLAEALGAPAA